VRRLIHALGCIPSFRADKQFAYGKYGQEFPVKWHRAKRFGKNRAIIKFLVPKIKVVTVMFACLQILSQEQ